jgi:hypothetical protein
MTNIMGHLWWSNKQRKLQDGRDKIEAEWKKKQAKIEKKKARKKDAHIRKKMGLIRYVCCPCLRSFYDDRKDQLTAEERAERDRQIALGKI